MTTKEFDPNAAATKDSGIFGLPYSVADAKLILLPMPWEATVSYGNGTSEGPEAIFAASKQVDLFDLELGNFFTAGIAMAEHPFKVQEWNGIARQAALSVIEENDEQHKESALHTVNEFSKKMNEYVYTQTKALLTAGKKVGLIGGDHSTPLGAIRAHLEKYPNMAILHFDAHADLRNAYEGFTYSHASIMYNVMEETEVSKIVQVGVRDFCEEEFDYIQENNPRIVTFFDDILSEQKMQGKPWATICDEIITHLPKEVYISFDIDGLDPRFCPHTGTPVPGGLDFKEAVYMFKRVIESGRTIVGFDLNEVSPSPENDWDANVGARLLYKLCAWTLQS